MRVCYVGADSLAVLEQSVNEKIREGYELSPGGFSFTGSRGYVQVMVKKVSEEESRSEYIDRHFGSALFPGFDTKKIKYLDASSVMPYNYVRYKDPDTGNELCAQVNSVYGNKVSVCGVDFGSPGVSINRSDLTSVWEYDE